MSQTQSQIIYFLCKSIKNKTKNANKNSLFILNILYLLASRTEKIAQWPQFLNLNSFL